MTRRNALIAGGAAALGLAAFAVACTSAPVGPPVERVTGGPAGTYVVPAGIHKIRHVIVIMQENRSFDSYFGTFPGADGIPMKNGSQPCACPTRRRRNAWRPTPTMPT